MRLDDSLLLISALTHITSQKGVALGLVTAAIWLDE